MVDRVLASKRKQRKGKHPQQKVKDGQRRDAKEAKESKTGVLLFFFGVTITG